MLKNFDNKEKLTKKEYYSLIKNNIHFNIGAIYQNNKGQYNLSQKELLNKLNSDFNNLKFLTTNCLILKTAVKNTIDFIHIDPNNKKLYEQQKGSFYKVQLDNNKLLILHYYKDSCNTISFKIIVKTTLI